MAASKKNLVIVESPAKAKTITKYLNGNKTLTSKYGTFIVLSSYGHVRDLAKGQISIDIEHDFTPTYQVTEDKKKIVTELRSKATEANMVWLASDHDREGEGIAAHLKEVLKLKTYKRITFTEITPKALEQAVQNPRLIDEHLVNSQETRRLLDRIVGFKLSPLLWKKYRTNSAVGLSAGRVQSAVMHIILQREKEIQGLKKIDSKNNFEVTSRFRQILLSVNGDYDKKTIREFIEYGFLAKDSRAFREYLSTISPGEI
jgi:DNA topoisomerase-1